MGDEPQAPTQTTTQVLSPEQQRILQLAMPGISQFASSVPQRYQGQTVAEFDPSQTSGQNMILGSAGGNLSNLAQGGANATNFMFGDIWNPAANPNLRGAIDASVRPITESYQQVVRPAIRDEFQGAGQQFGGSRRNLTETAGANAYMRNVGDTASKIAQGQYETNISAQLKALGLLPQTQQAQLAPGLATSGVGDVRQGLTQAMMNAGISGYNYDQLAPFLQSKELVSLLSGIPGGGVTSVGSVPQGPGVMQGLGGAAAGASLGSMFGPVGTVGGAGIGALLPFL